jgi:hypothetical protein
VAWFCRTSCGSITIIKIASDGSLEYTHEKGQVIKEQNEARVSSPVLQTSGSCKAIT